MLCGFGKKAVITFFNALFFNFEKFLLVTEERNSVLVLTPRNRVAQNLIWTLLHYSVFIGMTTSGKAINVLFLLFCITPQLMQQE